MSHSTYSRSELASMAADDWDMEDYLTGRAEHDAFHYATDSELDRASASELGYDQPDRAWILTDRDVWHKNPYYQGPPVPHPEDDYQDAMEEGR